MRTWLSNLSRRRSQRGQGLVEYASLIVLVAATAVGSLSALGGGVGTVYQTIICSLGEGGEECGCEYETITHGPSYTCVGGVFAAEAYTSCGTDTSLSMVIQNPDGTTEEVALSYDADNEVYSTVHTDTTDICGRLNGSPPASLFLVSRQNDGETVNTWRVGGTGGDDGGDEGGDDGGDDGGDTGGDDGGDTGGDDGGDTGGDDGGDTGGDDGGDTGGDDGGDTSGDDGGDTGGDDGGGGNIGAILGASPASLAFGDVPQGSPSSQTITLTHIGTTGAPALTVNSIMANGSDFSVLFSDPVVINPGESRSFNVIFTPGATGSRSGSLTITHTGELSPMTIALSGTGTSAAQTIAFIGSSSPSLDSNDAIIVDKLESWGYTVVTYNQYVGASTVLDASPSAIIISESIDSGNVNSKFRNTSVPVMVHEAYLLDDMRMSSWYGWVDGNDIRILDSSHPAAGGYSGNDVDIANSTSQMTAGQPPNSATVVATYRGSGNWDKAAIFVFDAGASLTSGTAAGRRASFPMGDNMAPRVNNTGWAMYAATLEWLLEGGSGGGGGGTGPTANATIGVSPMTIDYGTVVQGSSAQWNITISNTGPSGAAPLTISSLSVSGTNPGDFTTSVTPPITINQGQSTILTMTFTPGAVGARSASLAIHHDGSNTSPVVVSLAGEGTTPPPATLGVSTASVNFGDVVQGESGTANVRLTHTGASGALPIMISSMSPGGSHGGDFTLSPSAPFILNRGESRDVTVTFTPAATGSRSGTLSIAHDGTNTSPMTVSLSGQGVQGAPRIAVIVGNVGNLSSNNDHLLVGVLEGAGYTVTAIDDGDSDDMNKNDYDLIVVSASVNANTVGNEFRNTNRPVLVMERAILNDMNMAANDGWWINDSWWMTYENTSHPILNGVSDWIGNNSPVTIGRTTAASGATILSTYWERGRQYDVFFVFEAGGNFPARRVAMPIEQDSYDNVGPTGQRLFLNAVAWALG